MAKRHSNQFVDWRTPARAAALAACLGAAVLCTSPVTAQDRGSGALFAAIRANDLEAVKQIVASGADPRARDESGVSAPQAAVRLGHHVIAHYLLAYRRPKPDAPTDRAIDKALDEAVAETEKTTGPIPDAAPPPQAADTPVTLPEPAPPIAEATQEPEPPAPADVADRREGPKVPRQDETTPVLTPVPEEAGKTSSPLALDPETPAAKDVVKDAGAPKQNDKPGLLARAKGWLGGMLGFGDDKDTAPPPAMAVAEETAPAALTPPQADTGETPGAVPDVDRLAAATDGTMEPARPDLPEADLPRAIAQAPVPDDPLAKALAKPDGGTEPLPDGGMDPLLTLLDAAQDKPAGRPAPAVPAGGAAAKVDLMAMAPKERLAWLDALLAKPVARDAEDALSESKDEALSHLRERARRKAAAAAAQEAALSEAEKKALKTDLSAVDGPPPGTDLSRRLKVPLPPPDPKGRKNFARDPWFRDVSPDEPDVRAAHRSLRAPPPERGEPAPAIPKVPQFTNLPKGKDADKKLAADVPTPPPIRESARPAAPAATPAKPGDTLDALEKEFGSPPAKNDPLAAELGLNAPDAKKPAADPLAAELGIGGDGKAADPLAAELGVGAAPESEQNSAGAGDPLSQALGDLSSLIDGDKPAGPSAVEAEPPPATPADILAALPAGSQVRLDPEGRPALPAVWTLPVVLPGQAPPLKDLASAYVTPANFRAGFDKGTELGAQLGPMPPGANAASAWPVTKIQMADGAVVAPPATADAADGPPRSALGNEGRALEGVTLSIGSGASLYNTFIPENAKGGEGRAPECIEKAGGRTQFCIKELQWPAFLESKFLVSTILYTGTASVVRFDDGAPTRMQVVFAADGFDIIADWLVRRFGPPTATVTRSVAPFGQARRDNPTMIWRAVDRVTQKDVSLEIRHYDDTRDGFPDIRNGVMMLYREGAPGIFPQVSVHELMRLKRTG